MALAIDDALPQLGNVNSKASFRRLAFLMSVGFAFITMVAALFGNVPGPKIHAFLPICATLWATAELLTAFFLFSQFYVAGKLSYALIAIGYVFTGLLTIPYLYAFPGVFSESKPPLGVLQVSVWLWVIWHVTFPIVIGIAQLMDPTLERRVVAREAIGRVLFSILGTTSAAAVAISAVVWIFRDRLPLIVYANGHFSHGYSLYVAPSVVLANLVGCAIVARRLRYAKALQLWVAVALLTSALDGIVNATSPARYTLSWYLGKSEALTASSVVLLMLLFEISTLYRRLFDVASIDPLTGLLNRRTLDSEMREVLASLPKSPDGLSVLMLDIDKFKAFNDTHGHGEGDEVLRVIAGVISATASRPGDRIARYGGEEFIVVLCDTSLAGAKRVAERIRSAIEARQILLTNGSLASVTASIGVAFAGPRSRPTEAALFASADRALYVAKDRGRNCVVVDDAPPVRSEASLPICVDQRAFI